MFEGFGSGPTKVWPKENSPFTLSDLTRVRARALGTNTLMIAEDQMNEEPNEVRELKSLMDKLQPGGPGLSLKEMRRVDVLFWAVVPELLSQKEDK